MMMPSRRRGFSLLELATTVAALIILLGLMVSLASHVRNRSGRILTRSVLSRLQAVMDQYVQRTGAAPGMPPLLEGSDGEQEARLQAAALRNNEALAGFLRQSGLAAALEDLPLSIFSESGLRDTWGRPIVFMPPDAANVGMSPQHRYFFFSAGPDRKYSTLEDNLYSYEQAAQ